MDLYSGTPFWVRRAGLLQTYPRLDHDLDVEVLVVGARITGALVAHELSRAGLDVAVVDRRDVATGSTGATTGMLLYDTDSSLAELTDRLGEAAAVRVYQLGIDAIDRLEAIAASVGECGFARRPSLYFASRRRDTTSLRLEFERRRAAGLEVRWLDRADVAGEFGFESDAAILSSQAAELDSYRFTHGVLAAAAARGVRIYDRTCVSLPAATDARTERVVVSTSDGHRIAARRVVWATGYEAEHLIGQKTGDLASTWVVVTEPVGDLSGWTDRCLMWETARPYAYFRTTDDGRAMAGGDDEPCAECHRNERWYRRKTEKLLRRLQTMFPSVPIELAFAWAGTFATTRDGLPFIGGIPRFPNITFALAYGGNGIVFGQIAADIICRASLGDPHPDAWMFAFDRADRVTG